MAVRLSVIMVNSAPHRATAQRVAEAVVGELIGLAGIDLVLVDRLEQIQPTSSDFLTLDSLTGDVAVLDWQAAEATVATLNRLGFPGHRARHAHDLAATSAVNSRRIYAYDLNEFDGAPRVVSALGELLSSRQIRTFTLDGIRPQQPKERVEGAVPEAAASPSGNEKPPDRNILSDSANRPANAQAGSGAGSADRSGPRKTLDLDELVDQLDSLDLQ
jgi:hypothetical protein